MFNTNLLFMRYLVSLQLVIIIFCLKMEIVMVISNKRILFVFLFSLGFSYSWAWAAARPGDASPPIIAILSSPVAPPSAIAIAPAVVAGAPEAPVAGASDAADSGGRAGTARRPLDGYDGREDGSGKRQRQDNIVREEKEGKDGKAGDTKKVSDKERCTICLEEPTAGNLFVSLFSCDHKVMHRECAEGLINGGDPKCPVCRNQCTALSMALEAAIKENNIEKVEALLAPQATGESKVAEAVPVARTDLEIVIKIAQQLLLVAVIIGADLRIINALLDAGFDPAKRFYLTKIFGFSITCFDLYDLNNTDISAFDMMAFLGLHTLVKKCCENFKGIASSRNGDDATPLHYLAMGSRSGIEKFLKGLKKNKIVSHSGDYTCAEKNEKIKLTLGALLESGADPNAQDLKGDSFLHWCCFYKNSPAAGYLCAHDTINKDIRNDEGRTPLLEAIHRNATKVLQQISRKKVDFHVTDYKRNTIFHVAASAKMMRALRDLIVQEGSGMTEFTMISLMNARNDDVKTALDRAVDRVNVNVVTSLCAAYSKFLRNSTLIVRTPRVHRCKVAEIQAVLMVAQACATRALMPTDDKIVQRKLKDIAHRIAVVLYEDVNRALEMDDSMIRQDDASFIKSSPRSPVRRCVIM